VEETAVVGRTEGDLTLAALGVTRLALPIPFVRAGPVNGYLIENTDGSLTLFDAGLTTEESISALESGFEQTGRRLEEVSRILVSHGHVDHFGLAREIQRRSGATVYIHPADWNKVLVGRSFPPIDDYLRKLGVPEELFARIDLAHRTTEAYGERLPEVEPLQDGQRLAFARFEAEILHCPGHTPGLVCLHIPSRRILLTADHLLEHVTPNPVFELGEKGEEDKFQALVAYLESAQRVYSMDLEWLCPGHGKPFQNHRKILDSQLAFSRRRRARIAAGLEGASKAAFEVVSDIFRESSSMHVFLMISEVIGNIEVLEREGTVTHDPAETPYRFRLAH
jgi:glyoxylase-like metal-dependent hydrolase (beta-lactamase superfamily II)